MSRSSIATVREQPIVDVAVASGVFKVHAETLPVPTTQRIQLVDLTERVMARVRAIGIREGLVNLFSTHTTCTVFINEYQRALVEDMRRYIEQAVDANASWLHDSPEHSDCDRTNADAHLRALLLGHSLTLQVSGGELVLGQWQRVIVAELDGPRSRTLRLSVQGVA